MGEVTPHSNNETASVPDDPHGAWAELFADFADWRYLGKAPFEFERLVSELPELVPADEIASPVIFSVTRRLGPDAIARLVGAYESGTPTTQLTRDFGIAKGTVLRLLKENGVAMRQQPIPAEVISRAAELYESGLSLASAADRLGVNTSTLYHALRRTGVQMRPATGGRKRA